MIGILGRYFWVVLRLVKTLNSCYDPPISGFFFFYSAHKTNNFLIFKSRWYHFSIYFTLILFLFICESSHRFIQKPWIYTIWAWWFIVLELLFLLCNFLIVDVNLCQGDHLMFCEMCLRNTSFPPKLSHAF